MLARVERGHHVRFYRQSLDWNGDSDIGHDCLVHANRVVNDSVTFLRIDLSTQMEQAGNRSVRLERGRVANENAGLLVLNRAGCLPAPQLGCREYHDEKSIALRCGHVSARFSELQRRRLADSKR